MRCRTGADRSGPLSTPPPASRAYVFSEGGTGLHRPAAHRAAGRVAVRQVNPTGANLRTAYGYDNVGNVEFREVQTPGLEYLSELYQYDTLDRLVRFDRGVLDENHTQVTEPAPWPFVQRQSWRSADGGNLDLLGNWLATVSTVYQAPSTDTRTVNNVNEYLTRKLDSGSPISLLNDPNGNLIRDDAGRGYSYDAENRLTRVFTDANGNGVYDSYYDPLLQEYAYDALGRRVRTIDQPGRPWEKKTTHVYAGDASCLAEYDSTEAEGQARERWFVHGPNFPDPLVMVDQTDLREQPAAEHEYLYYLKDLLGSVTALANSNGAVVERYVYLTVA